MSNLPVWLVALATSAAPTGRGEVLDFSATYCPPCQQMAPVVARLEREGLPIRAVDVPSNRALAERFNIRAMPTFVLVIDGQEVARQTGVMSEDQLRGWLARIPRSAPELPASAGSGNTYRGNSFVADPNVRLGSAQSIIDAAPAPVRRPDAVAETRPAPQRETVPAEGAPKRKGLWPFNALARGEDGASNPPASQEIRANDSPLIASPSATSKPVPMDSSVRLRVTIDGRINLGSGTVVESVEGRSLLVTCGHIFRGFTEGSQIEVNLFAGEHETTLAGRLLKFDLESDVGLVEVETRDPLPIVLVARDVQQAREQEKVISIGCSGGQPPTREELVVTAVNPYLGPENLECTGIPVQGRSGGGLFRETGELVGVCIAADPARKRGVYAGLKAIHELLAAAGKSNLYQTPQTPAVAVDDGTPSAFPETTNGTVAVSASENLTAASGSERSLFDSVLPVQLVPSPEPVGETNSPRTTGQGFPTAGTAASPPVRSTPLALGADAADAEIVCIIRPRNQPESSSRVVIIHQASPKMLSYLSGELGGQAGASSLLSNEQPAGAGETTGRPLAAMLRSPGPESVERVSSTLSGRRPALHATVLSTPVEPRRYVRSR